MSRTNGGRNLTILGIGAIIIAGVMTTVSLTVYRLSGDIYLDRSRPGFLPDDEEVASDPDPSTTYTFPDTGELNTADLDQYLKELKAVIDRLDDFDDPYTPEPLSDQSLGIDGTTQQPSDVIGDDVVDSAE